jgi:hypothetical protein
MKDPLSRVSKGVLREEGRKGLRPSIKFMDNAYCVNT